MLFLNLKILFVSLGIAFGETNHPAETAQSIGYKAVIKTNDGFVATGSGGRIDWMTVSGKIVKSEKIEQGTFNCLVTYSNKVIVAGEHGAIFVSSEKGTFRKMISGTYQNINSMVQFKGKIIAGTDHGEIVSGDETGSFSKVHLAVKGNICSLSAGNGDCYGVTDEGEIIHTSDGANWDVFDFNKVYQGFYKSCSFTSILVTDKAIAVAGVYADGSPTFLVSSLGKVWSERTLSYKNEQGIQEMLTGKPIGIFYDDSQTLFYLLCKEGKLMKLPSCSHCNELDQLPGKNLTGISGVNDTKLVVGESFYAKPILE